MRFTGAENFTWRKGPPHEDPRMVSFHEALELLLKNSPLLAVESCRLQDAVGRVLRENVLADRAFPAFDRVMMDGYALRFSDWQAGQRSFRVTGSAPAGKSVTALSGESGTCIEVMTGAPCPLGADCIIPVEDVTEGGAGAVKFSDIRRSGRGAIHSPRRKRCRGRGDFTAIRLPARFAGNRRGGILWRGAAPGVEAAGNRRDRHRRRTRRGG